MVIAYQSVGRYGLAVGDYRYGLDTSKQVRICRVVGKFRCELGTGSLVGTAGMWEWLSMDRVPAS